MLIKPDCKYLYLVRHADAQPHHLADSDFKRRLTTEGIQRLQSLGRQLCSHSYPVQMIIASNAVRTQLTAEHLAKCFKLDTAKLHLTHDLYNADVETLLQTTQQTSNEHVQHLMLVAHNPGISEIGQVLCETGPYFLDPAAALVIELATDDWQAVHPGIGNLLAQIEPIG